MRPINGSLRGACAFVLVAGAISMDAAAQVQVDPGRGRRVQGGPLALTNTIQAPPAARDFLTSAQLPSDEYLRELEIPAAVLKNVVRLGDLKWEVRDAAARELFELAVADEIFLSVLLQADLDLEQRARLVSIVSRRISEAPRGAVGIRMRRGVGVEAGVVVEAVIEGMPGEKFMRAGDRITGIDGTAVVTSEDLTSIVQSRVPGQAIRVDIVRKLVDERGVTVVGNDGRPKTEEIRVEFPLGSVAQLDSRGGVSSSSRVLASRARIVDAIRIRFAPRSVRLRTAAVIEQEKAYEGRSPDTHPSVLWLQRRLELVESGLDDLDIDTRRAIRDALAVLIAEAADTGRSFAERAWLKRVINRYIELSPTE